MQETTIYIIRHAEAEGNLYRRIHGQYDSNVTENGLRQIAALEKRFAEVPVDAVYASDLTRTCRTAMAIAGPKGLEIRKEPRFREIRLGVWEDVPFGELERTDAKQMKNFNRDPKNWRVEGAERYDEFTGRWLDALNEVAQEESGKTIAICTHGSVTTTSLSKLFPGVNPGHCDNTGVAKLRYDGSWHLDYTSDNSHLSEEISTLARQNWWRSNPDQVDHNLWFNPFEGEIDWYLRLADEEIPVAPMAVIDFAMLGDTPAGLVQLDPQRGQEEKIGFIDYLGLGKKYRGKTLGIQLIGCAVSFYRNLGREKLRIEIPERYRRSIGFFERDGFRAVGANIYEKDIRVPEGSFR